MSSTDRTHHAAGADGPPHRARGRMARRPRIRLALAAAASGALATATALTLAMPAGASTGSTSTDVPARVHGSATGHALSLRAMPAGTATFGRGIHGSLTMHAHLFGLTPGSSHNVDLVTGGQFPAVRFSPLTANSVGQADSTLKSSFTGQLPRGSHLVVRMGIQGGGVGSEPIARTRRLSGPGYRPYRLTAVEVSRAGVSFGTPRGRATISYNQHRRTLTVTVDARGFTPGLHAAHIHLGSCLRQGPVLYMLKDLVADSHGIVHAVRVVYHASAPVPAHGWYLNTHQGNSNTILSNGKPTIFFRPLLCADL